MRSRPVLRETLLLLLLSVPHPSPAPAAPTPAGGVHSHLPIDLERWERNRPQAAAKSLADLTAGEPGTVRLIYFLPNDRPFRGAVVDSMKSVMRRIQGFYREQMQGHGFGEGSFPLETDAAGEPLVHRVDGRHPDIHYEEDTFTVLDELGPAFDPKRNIYVIVIDNGSNLIGNAGVYSGGAGSRHGKAGGVGLFPAGAVEWGDWELAAHELGHAFGLYHDFNDDAYIMSYGDGQPKSLSACNAEFLEAHPYFSGEEDAAGVPAIEVTSATTYPVGAESVPVQLEVSAADGLHQVMLLVRTVGNEYRREGLDFAVGSLEVKACLGFSGETRSRVEFDYDGVVPSGGFTSLADPAAHRITLLALDRDGDAAPVHLELTQASPYLIAAHGTEQVTSSALSPDGSTLALGRQDSRIELRDAATGASAGFLGGGHRGFVSAVAFSPDGSTLASGAEDEEIRLWDVAAGSLAATLKGQAGIGSLAFAPDGGSLAAFGWWDEAVIVWDVATATSTATLEGTGPVAFSPDGRTLATGSTDRKIRLWDLETGTETLVVRQPYPWISLLAFSPEGSTIALGSPERGIKLLDAASGEELGTLGERVFSLAWSPDGRTLASGSVSGEVELWDVAGGTRLAALEGHAGWVGLVAFGPDGLTLLSASNSFMSFFDGSALHWMGVSDDTIKLWDVSEWMGLRPQALEIASGEGQQGQPGEDLAEPFVVEVRDQNDEPLADVEVTFRVVANDGRLGGRFTLEKVTTDAAGQASSRLTLGPDPGLNRVEASVGGLTATFGSVGLGTPMPFMEGDSETWHLPRGAVARLGRGALGSRFEGDKGVAFSPDGRCLAVGSLIGIWLYDAATAREAALLPLAEEINSMAFSTDGTVLVSSSSRRDQGAIAGTVRLWDVATARSLGTFLEGYVSPMRSVSLSPDGTLLAAAVGDDVRLWDVATRAAAGTLEGHEGHVHSVSFSPDGMHLASAAEDRTIRLWEISTGGHLATLEGHGGGVRSVSFSPDGRSLASGADDHTIRLWDLEAGQSLATLTGHEAAVRSVAFASDGRSLASGSEDETVRVWDPATGVQTAVLNGHASWVRSVALSPDGRTLASAGTWDGKVNLWDLATGSAAVLDGHARSVRAVSTSPDGTLLASGLSSGRIELWDIPTASRLAVLEGHAGEVRAVAFSPDGRLLASGSDDLTVRLWDAATGTNTATLEGPEQHTGRIASVAFSPDGRTLATGSHDRTVKLWDAATGTHGADLEAHADRVTSVAFSRDGAALASASFDQTIRLWDPATRENTTTLEGHDGRVRSVSWSPDAAMLVSGADDGTVRLWDVASGTNTATLEGHSNAVASVAFTPDGTTLVSGSWDETIRLWDAASGENTATLEPGSLVYGISPSPGDMLASATRDGLVLLWDLRRARSHPRVLTGLSGDGQSAASGAQLAEPLVVEVRDQNGEAYPGAVVTFALTGGQGTLSALTDTTDAEGRAATTLTLGEELGTYSVVATVADLEPVTFTAAAKATPDFDGDGEVGLADFFLFAEAFGGSDPRFDLDGSGSVDFADFFLFAEHFGQPARAKLVAMARELIGLPEGPQLRQNAPNPFNSGTVISWFQLQPGPARLEVFALTGQRVAVLHEGPRKAGLHRLTWAGRDDQGHVVASGVYVYRLVTGEGTRTRKLTLLR